MFAIKNMCFVYKIGSDILEVTMTEEHIMFKRFEGKRLLSRGEVGREFPADQSCQTLLAMALKLARESSYPMPNQRKKTHVVLR